MFSDLSKGDKAKVSYTSERSGNTVSRTGKVLQVPNGDTRGFFIQSDDDQLTCVIGEEVFSLTVDMDSDERSVQRQTHLGTVESVSPA